MSQTIPRCFYYASWQTQFNIVRSAQSLKLLGDSATQVSLNFRLFFYFSQNFNLKYIFLCRYLCVYLQYCLLSVYFQPLNAHSFKRLPVNSSYLVNHILNSLNSAQLFIINIETHLCIIHCSICRSQLTFALSAVLINKQISQTKK